MSKTWKAILGVILVYLFGCLSGAVSTSIFFQHKMIQFLRHPAVALSGELEKRLTKNLELDANQKQQVHECFLENLQQRKDLQKTIQPQVQALNQQTLERISAILRPDQREQFDQNVEKSKMRFRGTAAPLNSPAASLPATNAGAGSPP
jgi:predicted component of type VI protein secretion system